MTERVEGTTSGPLVLRYDMGEIVRNLLLLCVGLQVLFFTLDFHINYAAGSEIGAVRRLFNTASEDSIASWFSIMQTAAIALTLWAIYLVVRASATRWQRAGWMMLAVFFSYLALDDGARIHEGIGTAYHDSFAGADGTFAAWTLELFPSYRWQIVFMPIFAIVGLAMFAFLLRQLRGWKPKAVVFLALALLGGAVGLDFFEGLASDHPWNPYTMITDTWHLDYMTARLFDERPYDTLVHFSKSIEECTEMFAMTLLWSVFLGHLGWLARDLRLRAAEPEASTVGARDEIRESEATPSLAQVA